MVVGSGLRVLFYHQFHIILRVLKPRECAQRTLRKDKILIGRGSKAALVSIEKHGIEFSGRLVISISNTHLLLNRISGPHDHKLTLITILRPGSLSAILFTDTTSQYHSSR